MPANHGLRLDDRDSIEDRWKNPVQADKQQPICVRQPRSLRGFAPKDIELVSEDQVLGLEPRARLEPRPSRVQYQRQELDHRPGQYPISFGGSYRIDFRRHRRVPGAPRSFRIRLANSSGADFGSRTARSSRCAGWPGRSTSSIACHTLRAFPRSKANSLELFQRDSIEPASPLLTGRIGRNFDPL